VLCFIYCNASRYDERHYAECRNAECYYDECRVTPKALLANISLYWKTPPATDTLTHYKHSQITDVKSLIRMGHGTTIKMLIYE
jgi:hypothetical protein